MTPFRKGMRFRGCRLHNVSLVKEDSSTLSSGVCGGGGSILIYLFICMDLCQPFVCVFLCRFPSNGCRPRSSIQASRPIPQQAAAQRTGTGAVWCPLHDGQIADRYAYPVQGSCCNWVLGSLWLGSDCGPENADPRVDLSLPVRRTEQVS